MTGRRANILDSPERPSLRVTNHNSQTSQKEAPRDLLMHHLTQLLNLAGTVAGQCTAAAENLAEANLEAEVLEYIWLE